MEIWLRVVHFEGSVRAGGPDFSGNGTSPGPFMQTLRVFRHHLHPSLILLALFEVAIAGSAWAGVLHVAGGSQILVVTHAVLAGVLVLVAMEAMGLFQPGLRERNAGVVLRILLSLGGAGVLLLLLWPPLPEVSVFTLLAGFLAVFTGIFVAHTGYLAWADRDGFKHRVLVLGTGRAAEPLTRMRRRADRRNFELLGFRPVEGEESGVGDAVMVRPDDPLPVQVRALGASEVVVAVEDRRERLAVDELIECRMSGVMITEAHTFYERETGKLTLRSLRPSWLAFNDGWYDGVLRQAGKRTLDVTASLALLAVVWPLMVLTALAILIESGRPVFYRQTRVGRDGSHFSLIKFRSMHQDAEAGGKAVWAVQDDRRVTGVGAVLRKTRLDELPQLLNVLRGDMSLVGPRPERPEFVDVLANAIPFYKERHRVKPGVTGWAQLCYPYGASEEDAAEKLQYDLYYLKNGSLFLDLVILVRTVEVVLFGKGAR